MQRISRKLLLRLYKATAAAGGAADAKVRREHVCGLDGPRILCFNRRLRVLDLCTREGYVDMRGVGTEGAEAV